MALGTIVAHAGFFADGAANFNGNQMGVWRIVMLVVIALAAVTLIRFAQPLLISGRRNRCLLRRVCEVIGVIGPLAAYVPVLMRVALGASLVLSATTGYFLAPGVAVPPNALAPLAVLESVIGLALVAGIGTRLAAACVVSLLFPIALASSPLSAGCRLDIPTMALFVLVMGGTPLSARLAPWELVSVARATFVLRIGLAAALFWTTIQEKLLHPNMTIEVLNAYPLADASRIMPITQLQFVHMAALVELVFAALILLLPVAEITIIGVAFPFIATVAIFGPLEIVGHLPIYGSAISLLLLAANTQTGRVVSALRMDSASLLSHPVTRFTPTTQTLWAPARPHTPWPATPPRLPADTGAHQPAHVARESTLEPGSFVLSGKRQSERDHAIV